MHSSPRLLLWRASDLLKNRRRMLLASEPPRGPRHVFGDILQSVRPQARRALKDILANAEGELQGVAASVRSSPQHVLQRMAKDVGDRLIKHMCSFMSTYPFRLGCHAFCYRCRQDCRIFGPLPGGPDAQNPSCLRVAIAGTTCTSWSSIGVGKA
eukprot:9236160-Alexandrium_andersonii.AAC.1